MISLEPNKPICLPPGTKWIRFDGDRERLLRWREMMGCKSFTYIVKEARPGVWHEAFSCVLEVREAVILTTSSERNQPSP